MKNLLFFGSLLFILFAFTTIEKKSIIYEGQGVCELNLSMSFEKANKILNSKYKKIRWMEFSYEYKYKKLGLSVWTKQKDSANKIFAISVSPKKWNGETKQGLIVSENLLVKDVIAVYGNPEWLYTEYCSEIEAEYDEVGIQFSVDLVKGICDEDSLNHD